MQITRLGLSCARFPNSSKAGALMLWAARQGGPVHGKLWLLRPTYLYAETLLMPGVFPLKHTRSVQGHRLQFCDRDPRPIRRPHPSRSHFR